MQTAHTEDGEKRRKKEKEGEKGGEKGRKGGGRGKKEKRGRMSEVGLLKSCAKQKTPTPPAH